MKKQISTMEDTLKSTGTLFKNNYLNSRWTIVAWILFLLRLPAFFNFVFLIPRKMTPHITSLSGS